MHHIAILVARAITRQFFVFPLNILNVQVPKPIEKLQDPKYKVQLRHAEFGHGAGISSFDDLMKKGGYEYSRSADKAGCCCSTSES